ncbi:MAG TPA: cytochrome b/b6 domain-containing protein [Xanthomonadaceae bacterium]|nr:cytochrome b/b6 domain-containing protein [Xanthomonadaceae bacterium]
MPAPAAEPVPVWDRIVRVLHLVFIVGIAGAWLTRHARGPVHEWIGYAVLAALLLRLAWGFAGPPTARFARFVRAPRITIAYGRGLLAGSAPRHLGHNPLGGWMIVALLLTMAVASVSGWMFTTDRYWGVAWVMAVHEWSSWAVLALAVLHVLGVLHASHAHDENLAAAMVHGRKRPPSGTDVPA